MLSDPGLILGVLFCTLKSQGSAGIVWTAFGERDLEGIVAKYKFGAYGGKDSLGTWYKIRNRDYSQMIGREKLFKRERHKEPVPGWHSCELACAEEAYGVDGDH